MTHAEAEDVDLLIIGGGKAGKSLAMDRAEAGWSVAMIERDKIGGTCINVACIPTKSLIESARTMETARRAPAMGVTFDGWPRTTVDALRGHKEAVVGGMVDAHRALFDDSGMDFIMGTARFVAERTVEVATTDGRRLLRGRDVVINTGTTPALPDLPGLADAEVWTTESILELERLPARLVILGGGYVGCEFASMLALLGVEVVVLQGPDQLLPREDADIAARVRALLTDQGAEVRTGVRARSVRRAPGHGPVTVVLDDGAEVTGDELLVATGRAPVTAELGLDSAGVERTDRGFVAVDDHLRTSADRVWAAGDVAGSPQFTHASWHDFRILRTNLTGGEASTAGRLVPYTVFITPELARVGMTETQARDAGHRIRVATIPVSAIPRAKTTHEHLGIWKAVVDATSNQILGVALLGRQAGEVVSAVQLAMIGGLGYQEVRDAVLTHPTMGEGLNLLFDAVDSTAESTSTDAPPTAAA